MAQTITTGSTQDVAGRTWTIETSPNAHVEVVPAASPADTPSLKFTFDYTDGNLDAPQMVTFKPQDTVMGTVTPNETYPNVFRSTFDVSIINDSHSDLHDFKLTMQSATPPTDPDVNSTHPDNYAHFHSFATDTFGPDEHISLTNPTGSASPFGPADQANTPAPDAATVRGDLHPGDKLATSGFPLVFHQEEVPNQDNSFSLVFTPIDPKSLGLHDGMGFMAMNNDAMPSAVDGRDLSVSLDDVGGLAAPAAAGSLYMEYQPASLAGAYMPVEQSAMYAMPLPS
jgi:hypothetical protein